MTSKSTRHDFLLGLKDALNEINPQDIYSDSPSRNQKDYSINKRVLNGWQLWLLDGKLDGFKKEDFTNDKLEDLEKVQSLVKDYQSIAGLKDEDRTEEAKAKALQALRELGQIFNGLLP